MTGCCGELTELLESIERTKVEIYKLKHRFDETSDPQERYLLKHKLKELRKLQFQQIKQLG